MVALSITEEPQHRTGLIALNVNTLTKGSVMLELMHVTVVAKQGTLQQTVLR